MPINPSLVALALLACGDAEVAVEEAPKTAKKRTAVGDADVTAVFAREESNGTWTFHVTVQHNDRDWSDFADGWDVVLPDGTAVRPDPYYAFTKQIRNPHVDEQPFTRTQRNIEIPSDVNTVRVRAHDKAGGFGGQEVEIDLNVRFGPNYSVKRAL